ncbi:hypothetical protein TELCIR_12343, partial [Teladorsagia circumcincta]
VPILSGRDYPTSDDIFLKEFTAVLIREDATTSRARRLILEEENKVGNVLKDEQVSKDTAYGRIPRKGEKVMQSAQIPIDETVMIDPALIGSGQVVCLGNQEAVNLINQAIKQVLDIHLPYGMKHFHVGANEAFRYGTCNHSLKSLHKNETSEDLAIKHIKTLALYVKSIAEEVRILAWHDMFKKFSEAKIKHYKMGDVLELVIWEYSETLATMPHHSFLHMGQLFPKLWASSAFKGADFPAATFANVQLYETNNLNWLRKMRETRWKGAKAREIGEGVKLYYNGEDTKRNGVAIAVAESLKDHVSAVNRVSDRIMAVRIDTKEGYWSILSVYAPQAGCPGSEKDVSP